MPSLPMAQTFTSGGRAHSKSETMPEVIEVGIKKSGTRLRVSAGETALIAIREDRANSVSPSSMKAKRFQVLRKQEVSEEAAWATIMSQPTPPSQASTLSERWEELESKYRKRGKIAVIQDPVAAPSCPVWIADVDRSRAYRSLSTMVKVTDSNGNQKAFDMVVDTGSCATLTSKRTWDDMGSPPLFKPDRIINLHDANGQALKVLGLFEMKTWFGDQMVLVDALVIRDLAPAILLGMDFLHKAQALVDLENMELRMPHMKPIKLCCGPPGQCRLGKTICLKAKEAAQVWISAPAGCKEDQMLLTSGRTLCAGVHVARSVGPVCNGQLAVQICNTNDVEVELNASRFVTQAEEVSSHHFQLSPEAVMKEA